MTKKDCIAVSCLSVLALGFLSFVSSVNFSSAILTAIILIAGIWAYRVYFTSSAAIEPLPADISLREQARMADGIPEAIIIVSRREKIVYANSAAKSLFGISDQLPSLSSLTRDKSIHRLVRDTLAGQNSDPVTYHISAPVERHIRVMGSPIISENQKEQTHRAIIFFYDITDLVRVNTMRADFLANASHELKTPVASLLGYIETLRGHAKDDPKAQETFLGIMQQQAERMQRLIDDLLSLRRIEIVEHLVPTETADLYLATRAATEAITPLSKKRGVKIKYQGPKEALVIGVQDELVQLVLNLMDNAVMITPKKDVITLTCNIILDPSAFQPKSTSPDLDDALRRDIVPLTESTSGYAVLRVRDQGPGFPKEHLPRVGERFYKISGIDTGHKRGTGLGLAIVKHIMRRHRGGLFIETKEGVGTEFTMALPLSPQSDIQK